MILESRLLHLALASRYALSAVACLATDESGRYHAVQEIAERSRVSSSYLSKILQTLAREGVVASRRGARGGYRLVKSAGHLSLAEVVRASRIMENEPAQCMIEARGCGDASPCALHPYVGRSEREWWRRLENTTVAQLSRGQAAFLADPKSRAPESR